MNILITNIGRRGYLVDYIKSIIDFKGKVYVSDCDRTASGLYGNNDGHFLLSKPSDDEELYVHDLLRLCKKIDIQLIIPVIDPEIFILSKYRDLFLCDQIHILVSSPEVLEICYNKLKMNIFLDESNLLYPKTYHSLIDFLNAFQKGNIQFPVIVKPIYGSGSVETSIVNNIDEVKALFHEGLMIQEFIKGQEYGIDVLNDFDGNPIRCVIKKKIAMRSGETDKALTIKDELILQQSLILSKTLKHIGNLDFDIIKKDDKVFVIDLNPRFGGGYPATHAAGGKYLELIIRMLQGEVIEPKFNDYIDNLLVMKTISVEVIHWENHE